MRVGRAGLGLKFGPGYIRPTSSPMNVFWVIGPSIGVNKLINKTGQKQIMMDITEFKANAFLSDRNALDNKAMILS